MSLEDIRKRWANIEAIAESMDKSLPGLGMQFAPIASEIRKLIAYAEACNAYFDNYIDPEFRDDYMEQVATARKELEGMKLKHSAKVETDFDKILEDSKTSDEKLQAIFEAGFEFRLLTWGDKRRGDLMVKATLYGDTHFSYDQICLNIKDAVDWLYENTVGKE